MAALMKTWLKGEDAPLALIALAQGLLLMGLYGLLENGLWPSESPPWRLLLFTVILVGPTLLLLGLGPAAGRARLGGMAAAFTLLAALLAYYAGAQMLPPPLPDTPSFFAGIAFLFASLLFIAAFKALMYMQHFASGEPFSYSALFRWSWRNFLIFVLAWVFACVFRLILVLWQLLFKAIGIDFFEELFSKDWFITPALVLAFGMGIVILRKQSHIIDTIAQVQQALMRLLLPLLVGIAMLFLLALAFTGLAPFWEGGGSWLALWTLALILFFVNAVYKDDPSLRPYPLWLHRLVYLGVGLLPVYSAISCYGLTLRIMQHGWSVGRGLGALVWTLLALFALCYSYSILRRRDSWLAAASRINVRLGLVVLAAMLLANSPLLDFRKVSVSSQLARLEYGQVSPEEFDVDYFARHLGRPGYEALQDLEASHREANPEFAERIAAALARWLPNKETAAERAKQLAQALVQELAQEAGTAPAPPSLADALAKALAEQSPRRLRTWDYHLLPMDLDADGRADYLLIKTGRHSPRGKLDLNLTLFYRDGPESAAAPWQQEYLYPQDPSLPKEDIVQRLLQGDYTLAPQRWRQIEAGPATLKP